MNLEASTYDKTKIGKLIAWGGDHFVYDYDANKVIKFSIFEWMFGKEGPVKTIRDYKVCKQFFGKYLLDSEIKTSQSGRWTALIQTKIVGRYLYKADLDNILIAEQFREIMANYNLLLESGNSPIDLMGSSGVFVNRLSNIFVTPDNKLLIIDSTLLEFKTAPIILKPFFFILGAGIRFRQNYLIKNFAVHVKRI